VGAAGHVFRSQKVERGSFFIDFLIWSGLLRASEPWGEIWPSVPKPGRGGFAAEGEGVHAWRGWFFFFSCGGTGGGGGREKRKQWGMRPGASEFKEGGMIGLPSKKAFFVVYGGMRGDSFFPRLGRGWVLGVIWGGGFGRGAERGRVQACVPAGKRMFGAFGEATRSRRVPPPRVFFLWGDEAFSFGRVGMAVHGGARFPGRQGTPHVVLQSLSVYREVGRREGGAVFFVAGVGSSVGIRRRSPNITTTHVSFDV